MTNKGAGYIDAGKDSFSASMYPDRWLDHLNYLKFLRHWPTLLVIDQARLIRLLFAFRICRAEPRVEPMT